jgi:hypothetical protein
MFISLSYPVITNFGYNKQILFIFFQSQIHAYYINQHSYIKFQL